MRGREELEPSLDAGHCRRAVSPDLSKPRPLGSQAPRPRVCARARGFWGQGCACFTLNQQWWALPALEPSKVLGKGFSRLLVASDGFWWPLVARGLCQPLHSAFSLCVCTPMSPLSSGPPLPGQAQLTLTRVCLPRPYFPIRSQLQLPVGGVPFVHTCERTCM